MPRTPDPYRSSVEARCAAARRQVNELREENEKLKRMIEDMETKKYPWLRAFIAYLTIIIGIGVILYVVIGGLITSHTQLVWLPTVFAGVVGGVVVAVGYWFQDN